VRSPTLFDAGCSGPVTETSSSAADLEQQPQQQDDGDMPPPESFDRHLSTEHFQLSWNAGESSPEEVEEVRSALEPMWTGLSGWLGASRMPAGTIQVQLEGDGMKPNAPPAFPRVGAKGRVHLFRFPGVSGSYVRQLVHETVHSTRYMIGLVERHQADYTTGYGFVEEGFAEMVAREIEPSQPGFPLFGFSLEVAAGAWVSSGEDIPMTILMGRQDLNERCMGKAYPQRASFMKFLSETFGKDSLLALAYSERPVTEELYLALFGQSSAQLTAAWRTWALARLTLVPTGAEQATQYRQSPVQYFPICKAGADF
jgi:hypothetical protein